MSRDLDMDGVLDDMAAAVGKVVSESSGEIAAHAREALEGQRRALEELARARVAEEIDDTVLERQIDREKRVLRAELLAVAMMTEAAAEQAWNAARETFLNAVKSAARGVL